MSIWMIVYQSGILPSAFLSAAMFHTYFSREFPTVFSLRGDLSMAAFIGVFCALFWPLGIPELYFLTRCAKHGLSFRIDPRLTK